MLSYLVSPQIVMETVSPHVGHRRWLRSSSPLLVSRSSAFLDDLAIFFHETLLLRILSCHSWVSKGTYYRVYPVHKYSPIIQYYWIAVYAHSRCTKGPKVGFSPISAPFPSTAGPPDLSLCLLLLLELVRLSWPPFSPALGPGRPRWNLCHHW